MLLLACIQKTDRDDLMATEYSVPGDQGYPEES